MNIFVKLKSVGRRRPVLDNTPYVLADGICTLRQLIEVIVIQEVGRYNNRGADNTLVPFLTQEEIENQRGAGKVSFGVLYSDGKADPDKAVKTALLGFEDGLFRVVVEDDEITELDAALDIREGSVITFIRLTFLSENIW
ncbi:MAG: hypothetical protein FWH57_10920 [Oscillospiraceae bacterium]|nr:hypothetical protein [Oscillospiraceae bacterium]